MPLPERLGRLQRVSRLGSGGFATVWLYRDETLDSLVAVKALAENWAQRADVSDRFLEEARVLRRADSDHVVRVYDIGEDGDRPYFVMSYADKGTVGDLIARAPLPAQEVADVVWQAAQGLDVLHRMGIVLLVVGTLVFTVLVFVAGWIAGSARTKATFRPAVTLAKPAVPAVPKPAVPKIAAPSTAALFPAPAAKPAAAPTPAATDSAAPELFTLRVAAFATEEEAKARVAELAARNLEATIVPMPTSSATILYSVCIGQYPGRIAAADAADALAKQHGLDAAVVPVP